MADQQSTSTDRNENGSHRLSFFRSTFAWCAIEHCNGVCRFTVPLKRTVRDIDVVLDNALDTSALVSNICFRPIFQQ